VINNWLCRCICREKIRNINTIEQVGTSNFDGKNLKKKKKKAFWRGENYLPFLLKERRKKKCVKKFYCN
jgi:hypothetical protein